MKINIVGTGNVGWHLAKALDGRHEVSVANSRTLSGLDCGSDIILIAVPDHAIAEVAAKIAAKLDECGGIADTVVAHTSGTTSIESLQGLPCRYGGMWPLQTFTKGIPLAYNEIPMFIEGSDQAAADKIRNMAESISLSVIESDSDTRKKLHLCSVISCNFVNHLMALADKYLENTGIGLDMLMPLINATVRKIDNAHPVEVQTGPAIRRDYNTMAEHMRMLAAEPRLQKIYSMLSESIILTDDERNQL